MRADVMRMDVAAWRIALLWTTLRLLVSQFEEGGSVAHTPRPSNKKRPSKRALECG